MKKLLCLLLALVLTLTSVSALAELTRVAPEGETKEFTFWAAYNPTYQTDWESMKCWTYLEEATGIHINWVLFANSGEMKEKLQLLIAGADLNEFPDAFFRASVSDAQLKKYGPEGLFMDVKDLVKEYAPNLCARLDALNAWSSVTDPETGAMYSTPCINDSSSGLILPKLFLNKQMLENIGATELPTTLDELYDMLVKVRDMDANGNGDPDDEVGISSNSITRMMWLFTGAFGIDNRGRTDASVDADPADETKIRFVYTSDGYRQMLSYLNKLYTEKLIDQDMFALSTSKMVALGSQDQLFGIAYHNLGAAAVQDEDYTYLTEPLEGPEGYKEWNTKANGIGVGNFVISAGCKDPVSLIKWIDNLYSDEGSLLIYYGKEGEDFYYNEEGLPVYNDELLSQVNAENPYDKVISSVTCYASGGIPSYFNSTTHPGAENRGISLEAGLAMEPYTPKTVWSFNFTQEETEELNALKADLITNCHDVYRAKFVTGELDVNDDAVWNAYVAEMEKNGLADYVYYYQCALDRMLAE